MRHPAAWLAAITILGTPAPARPELRSIGALRLNPMHAAAVERALDGAARRLEQPDCRRIFSDFEDTAGVSLQDRLAAFDMPPRDYLRLIVFADGSGRRACHGTDVLAVTAPGSRVVYVCGRRFLDAQQRSAERAEIVVLHEALHTLGLGENPPDSLEISRRVAQRCAPATAGGRAR